MANDEWLTIEWWLIDLYVLKQNNKLILYHETYLVMKRKYFLETSAWEYIR